MSSPYSHILFAADLRFTSKELQQKVYALAEMFKARLSVLHVLNPELAEHHKLSQQVSSPFNTNIKHAISTFCKPLEIPSFDQLIKIGHPLQEILNTVTEYNIDLLLVGQSYFLSAKKSKEHLSETLPCEMMLLIDCFT